MPTWPIRGPNPSVRREGAAGGDSGAGERNLPARLEAQRLVLSAQRRAQLTLVIAATEPRVHRDRRCQSSAPWGSRRASAGSAPKAKELIGLAVSLAHTVCTIMPRPPGTRATDAQIKEAIAAAALTRKWSTMLNGNNYDMGEFKKQIDAAFAGSPTTTGMRHWFAAAVMVVEGAYTPRPSSASDVIATVTC
jgi:hypothetical protein